MQRTPPFWHKRYFRISSLLLIATLPPSFTFATPSLSGTTTSWGVDGCLTIAEPGTNIAPYLKLLDAANISIIRERDQPTVGEARIELRRSQLKSIAAGNRKIVGFLSIPDTPKRAAGFLPDDLMAVYRLAAREASTYKDVITAWEVLGESDIGFSKDPPDQVIALLKSAYLGIKAANPKDPSTILALMPALALPPGPWLRRALENDMLRYTDAYNIHYYGENRFFGSILNAHHKIEDDWANQNQAKSLPIWITECGFDTLVPAEPKLLRARLELQSTTLVSNAKVAAQSGFVSVFMPFVFYHRGDTFSLTDDRARPTLTWIKYSNFVKTRITRKFDHIVEPRTKNSPIVLQWLPNPRLLVPHKQSGSYRFDSSNTIESAVRIYNFSNKPTDGSLRILVSKPTAIQVKIAHDTQISLMPFETTLVPIFITPSDATSRYVNDKVDVVFQTPDLVQSRSSFSIENWPSPENLVPQQWHIEPREQLTPIYPAYDVNNIISSAGSWIGINGLVLSAHHEGLGEVLRASLQAKEKDPLFPPMAIARVNGLPENAFIRIQTSYVSNGSSGLRVDLLTDSGARYTVWENLGANYFRPSSDIWLNLRDFGQLFGGTGEPKFNLDPSTVKEMQIRYYFSKAPAKSENIISIWIPKG